MNPRYGNLRGQGVSQVRKFGGRRVLAMGVLACVAGAVTTGVGDAASSRTVKVRDSFYSPKRLEVRSGTKVVWRFGGQLPHNVEVTRGPELFSSSIKKDGTFARTLRKRGTYKVVCTLHEATMTMKVVVR